MNDTLVAENQDNRSREQCIALRLQGYSQRRIAEMLGVSQSTVRHHTRHLPPLKKPAHKRSVRRAVEVTPLAPSEDFAYFLGVFAGDGNLYQTKRSYQITIACDLRYPDLIEKYSELTARVVGRKVRAQLRHKGDKPATWATLLCHHAHAPTLLSLPPGAKKDNGSAVPEWMFGDVRYMRAFLRGLIETDGGVYSTFHNGGTFWYCAFTAKVPGVVDAFLKAVVQLGYPFKQYGPTFRLSDSARVRELIEDLGISKIREYRYERKRS